ncbi:hypothetical protein HMN09_00777100 [Mycena chlorophos]|uniref:Uncharacterized protein n=1 Tax=Mycena chlorophos TaxID=658473 RepID=A0A8H6SVT4_MYCCL|nr:hypothetical protein HMN09_00777100 [Mycena chlorophos]
MAALQDRREQGLRDAAALERQSLKQASRPAHELDRPPTTTLVKQLRKRPEGAVQAEVNYGVSPEKGRVSSGSGSEGDFVPEDDDDEDDEDEGEDEMMDAYTLRDEGRAEEVDQSLKRKASKSGSAKEGRKRSRTQTGVLPGWDSESSPAFYGSKQDRGRSHTPQSTHRSVGSRSRSGGSALSVPLSDAASSDRPWGIGTDEDELEERQYAEEIVDVGKGRKTTDSFAGIEEPDAPELARRRPRAPDGIKKGDLRDHHLPASVQGRFYVDYGGTLISYVGAQEPWHRPTVENQVALYNDTFDRDISERTPSLELRAVLKLSEDRINGYQNSLAGEAMAAVASLFAGKTEDYVRTAVAKLLAIVESDKFTEYRVFYFAKVDESRDEAGNVEYTNPQEIFRHPLVRILRTLGRFCKLTKTSDNQIGPLPAVPLFSLSKWSVELWSSGCTTYTTFGPNQSYFSTSDNGVSWQNLPPMLEDTIMNNLKVKTPAMVALGAEGTFVMVYNTGEYTWHLPAAGSDAEAGGEKQPPAYAGLEKLLTPAGNSEARKRGGVKYAALSPYNTTEYFVLFGDNTTHWDLPAEWHVDVRGCIKHWTATLDATTQAQAAVTTGKKEHSHTHGDWSELIEGFNKGVEFTTNIVQLVQAAQGNS